MFVVRYSQEPLEGSYREARPGVFVSSLVSTELDFPLKEGFYTVWALSNEVYDNIYGESLDLALLMASVDEFGVYSADVNPDFTLSPVYGLDEKRKALERFGLGSFLPSY